MWNEDDTVEDGTPLWERRSPRESRARSVPDVSMSAQIDVPQKAASDMPKSIPLFKTLEENEDLMNKNQLQRLEIIRLNEIIWNITGKDQQQLAEEYSSMKSREKELVQTKEEAEKVKNAVLAESEALKQKIADLEHLSNEIRTENEQAAQKLEEVRERFPWMDESIDSIFGDPNQRFIGDLQQRIQELGYEREDLIKAKNELENELREARSKLSEWSTKGCPGDQTFAVDVGDLHKITYQEKIEELQKAIDERDAKIQEQDINYKKAIRLLTDVEKSKTKLEQQIASLTMTIPGAQMTNELRESSIGTEERRMETASQWLGRLATLGNENERLKKALIELGGKYREMSLREGSSLIPNEIDSILDYAEEVQQNLKQQQDVFNFTEQHNEADEVSLRILNESKIAKESLDEIKEKFAKLKANTRMLFERMKSSSDLFAKILRHIKGGESELAEEIRRMTLVLDGSMHQQSMIAFEEIELAFHEASWVLEKSLNESCGTNLSQIMSRLGAGQSQPEVSKLLTKLTGSPQVTPSSPRFVNKQTFDEISSKYEQLIDEFDEAKEKWAVEKQSLEEMIGKAAQFTTGMERQLEMAKKNECEANLQCSELKEEVERLRAEESKLNHENEEIRRELKDREEFLQKHEADVAKYHDRQAAFENKAREYIQQISSLQSEKDDFEAEFTGLQARFQEVTTEYKKMEKERQEKMQRLTEQLDDKELECEQLHQEATTLAHRASENDKRFENTLANARSEIASLKHANDKEMTEVEHSVQRLCKLAKELAKVQGVESGDKTAGIRQATDGRPIPTKVFELLDSLSTSLTKSCEWTRQHLHKEQENRHKIEEITSALDLISSKQGVKEVIASQQSSIVNLENVDYGKENSPPGNQQGARKFKDPLRNEFYDICTRADQIVQQLKNICQNTPAKNAAEVSLVNKVLEDARTLRAITTQKYQALMAPVKDAEGLTSADLLERITIMWQQIYMYQTTLVETRKLLKEAKQRSEGKAGCQLEDQAFGSQIENELAKIKDVLNRCGAAATKAKQGLIEQSNH